MASLVVANDSATKPDDACVAMVTNERTSMRKSSKNRFDLFVRKKRFRRFFLTVLVGRRQSRMILLMTAATPTALQDIINTTKPAIYQLTSLTVLQ